MKKRIGFIWAVAALLVFVAGMGFGRTRDSVAER